MILLHQRYNSQLHFPGIRVYQKYTWWCLMNLRKSDHCCDKCKWKKDGGSRQIGTKTEISFRTKQKMLRILYACEMRCAYFYFYKEVLIKSLKQTSNVWTKVRLISNFFWNPQFERIFHKVLTKTNSFSCLVTNHSGIFL